MTGCLGPPERHGPAASHRRSSQVHAAEQQKIGDTVKTVRYGTHAIDQSSKTYSHQLSCKREPGLHAELLNLGSMLVCRHGPLDGWLSDRRGRWNSRAGSIYAKEDRVSMASNTNIIHHKKRG